MLFPIKDHNPTKKTSYITIIIIAINIIIFFYQSFLYSPPPDYQRLSSLNYHILKFSMIPREIIHLKNITFDLRKNLFEKHLYIKREIPPFLTLFTSIFMHGSILHLLGNMLFLWIFGNNIEDYLGKLKFIIFYLIAGIGASLVHVLFNWNSITPVIGASGAISGVMGAYLILYPRAKVKTLVFLFIFVTFIDLPAYVFLIVWFVFQFAGAEGVAWLAHVGGFIVGIFLIKLFRDKKKPVIEFIE